MVHGSIRCASKTASRYNQRRDQPSRRRHQGLEVDFWKIDQWKSKLAEADVVVCTPDIARNALTHAYCQLEEISLLIFDEAHRCRKKHAYRVIMNTHYHPLKTSYPNPQLPKILAMTASPLYQEKNVEKSVRDLEKDLDSKLLEVTIPPHLSIASSANQQLVEFDAPDIHDESLPPFELEEVLRQRVPTLSSKVWTRIERTKFELGFDAAELYTSHLIASLPPTPPPEFDPSTTSTKNITKRYFSSTSDATRLSPRVRKLVDVLSHQRLTRTDLRAMIFVRQKRHAVILSEMLSTVPELQTWISPDFLVGHGGSKGLGKQVEGKDSSVELVLEMHCLGMDSKDQEKTVARFRSGATNVLLTTSVAEEGLDFSDVNLVVMFDPPTNLVAFVQSRGRARAPNSTYIVLSQKGSEESEKYLSYEKQEPLLTASYQNRPLDNSDTLEEDADDEEDDSDYLFSLPKYKTPSGAVLDHFSAVPLLSSVCSILPTDEFTLSLPRYEIEGSGTAWMARLRLPMMASLPGVKEIVGDLMRSKSAAKQSAAFKACEMIHKAGRLNDNLLPVRPLEGPGTLDVDGRVLPTETSAKTVEVTRDNVFGDVWNLDAEAYLHVFEIVDRGASSQIGLVCGAHLNFDASSLFRRPRPEQGQDEEEEILVRLISSGPIDLDHGYPHRRARLIELEGLNRDSIRLMVNRNLKEQPLYTLWAPVTVDHAGCYNVDWEIVYDAFRIPQEPDFVPGTTMYVFSRRARCPIMRLDYVRQDVTTLSPTSEIELSPSSRMAPIITKYPVYYRYAKIAIGALNISDTEPEKILALQPVPVDAPNLLVSRLTSLFPEHIAPTTSSRSPLSHMYPVSVCRVSNLPGSWFEIFRTLPSLNRLVHDSAHAHAIVSKFGFPPLDTRLLTHALTAPSACTGYHFQTLETLGDSVLKICTSIHTYLTHQTSHEGELSALRQNGVSNRALRIRSVESGFNSAVLTELFRPGSRWLPHLAEDCTPSDDKKTAVRRVGRKVLCDTVEATLGVAYLSGGIEASLKVGERLGLCFGGTVAWPQRERAVDLGSTEWPGETPPSLRPIETKLDYNFKNPMFLLQAVTHRSYTLAETHCYEREEFLGDAILDYWATTRLWSHFGSTTNFLNPKRLSFLRAILVSNATLAFLAIKVLGIHSSILRNSFHLDTEIRQSVESCEAWGLERVVNEPLTWSWDPPKVLGDVLEALLGAVFVDSGCTLQPVLRILDNVLFRDVMPLVNEKTRLRDWRSELGMALDKRGCKRWDIQVIKIDSTTPSRGIYRPSFQATAFFHDQPAPIPAITSSSRFVARQQAAKSLLDLVASLADEETCLYCAEARELLKKEQKIKEEALKVSQLLEESRLAAEEIEMETDGSLCGPTEDEILVNESSEEEDEAKTESRKRALDEEEGVGQLVGGFTADASRNDSVADDGPNQPPKRVRTYWEVEETEEAATSVAIV
ncbi:hypothetical protein T439DRAFT_325399 [Meredithblackwellia eburnea MCA 4105]